MISLLETILQRPKTVFSLMVALLIGGIVSYVTIPKEADPNIDVPFYYVSIGQQGISPEDGERLIGRPMEAELRGIEGLKELSTISSEGHVGVLLEFNIDVPKDEAISNVREKVDLAKAKLPADANEPTINSFNMALKPTISIALSGNVPERTLYREARRLKDVIEAISSVKEAELSGHREELLEVVIDTMKMESYKVTQAELLSAVSRNNQLIPAGVLEGAGGRFNIKVPGLVETASDVYALPLKQQGEAVVTLGDIATIKRTFKDPSSYALVNGEQAIRLDVVKRIGQNILENNAAVRKAVAEATKDMPETVKVSYMLDESDVIHKMLSSLQGSIMTAVMLVMVVVVASLGLKSALLVGLAIPTSFMVGFLILSGSGMTLNTMVMFGLVLTVGLLVDSAIVMVEYSDRKIAEGMEVRAAYIRAAKLMFWPIFSSTATTLAAFLPMLLWPGVSGKFMSYLPIMVIIVLSASLLTAVVFLPVTGGILSKVFAFVGRHGERICAVALGAVVGLFVGGLPVFAQFGVAALIVGMIIGVIALYVPLVRMFTPLIAYSRRRAEERHEKELEAAKVFEGRRFDPKKVKGVTGVYVRMLARIAGTRLGSVIAIVSVIALCAGIFMTFASNNNGVDFFVDDEASQAQVFISARGNMSADEALKLVREVDSIVLGVKGVKNVVTTAYPSGARGSNNQDRPADTIGQLSVEFTDFCCRRPAVQIFAEIREKTSSIPGLKVETRAMEGGPPQGKDVQIQVTSDNYQAMVAAVGRVREKLDATEGLMNQEDSRPLPGIEWLLTIDREAAARYQADIASVGAMVQLVTNGVKIGDYRPGDSEDEVDIRVRLPEGERTMARFEQLRLRTPLGLVPLSNFVKQSAQQKVSFITRRDGYYAMDVKASIDPAGELRKDQHIANLHAWVDGETWPENVTLKFRGGDEEQASSQAFLMKAMIGSLFLMLIILLTQFNSFYQTFLTLTTVVLSVFGVLLGMLVTGQKFSVIMTGTGILALAGIVVNNSIVLIDTYNRFRHDGMVPLDAILKTATQRIRPILLTTTTTIAGLLPMATQLSFNFVERVTSYVTITSAWWVQLSTAVIFGLGFSTLLTLVVIPTLIAAPSVWVRGFRRGRRRRTGKADLHQRLLEDDSALEEPKRAAPVAAE
ncbi:efflux RND transporter permease subunit [Polycladidibacter hongkongensis]|uniref:efflux RND transporter permease subunit n=1 Tax=Polycladidibacter hongkongensis TaxID=1647556 RepID=UPI000832EDE6|nr:efflux RND transporter permease subunit [Pseudovibrio hongkongensis]